MRKFCARVLAGLLAIAVVFTTDFFPLSAEENDRMTLQITDDTAGADVYCGDTVTLSAQVVNGASSYEYSVSLLNSEDEVGTGSGTVLRDFSAESNYVFLAEEPGEYIFEITARDSEGLKASGTHVIHVLELENELPPAEEVAPESPDPIEGIETEEPKLEDESASQEKVQQEEKAGKVLGSTQNVPMARKVLLTGSLTSSSGNTLDLGEVTTLTAISSGGAGNVEYRFTETYNGTAKTVQGYSEENTYTYKAKGEGLHTFTLAIRDGEGNVANATYNINVKISSGKKLAGRLTSSTGTTADVRENVTLTASHGGGYGKIEYRFTEIYNGKVTTVQQYGEENTYKFQATDPGVHTYQIAVRDEEGQIANAKYSIMVSVPSSKKLSGRLTSSTGTTADVRESVTLTASHGGGYGKIEYRFTEIYNGKVTTVQQYGEENTYKFQATDPGVHTYQIAVRDEEGQIANAKYSITVSVPSSKKLSGRLTSSTGTTADVRESVTLTASHGGGYGKIEYRFTEIYNGKVTTVQQYGEENTYKFQATDPGVHTYQIAVRDEEGQIANAKYSITVSVPSSKKLSGRLTSSTGTTADVRESVTLTASHGGGYGKIEYRFTEIYNGKVTTVQQYGEENTYKFQATDPGVHTYQIAVRDEEGQIANAKYSITVSVPSSKKLSGRLTSSTGTTADVRESVTLTASHGGGYGKIEYRFTEIYNGKVTTVQQYGEENTYKFQATDPGVHTYQIAVRDEEGQIANAKYSITVLVPEQYRLQGNVQSDSSNSVYVDRMVKLTVAHTGGYGGVKYRFTEVYNGIAETVQPYSENNEYTFRTTKPGVHKYNVAIQDCEGQTITLSYVMTVVVHPDYVLAGTLTKNVSGTIKENQEIVLTAQAKKGYGAPYLYRFTEVYNGKAKTVQAYSTDNTYSFKIQGYGVHKYTVSIQDCEGQTTSLSLSISLGKNGWYYEGGYKFYYKNNVKQLDLDGILPKQSSYEIWVNRQSCTVTVYAKDGSNGYIIPVKRFACSVGLPSTPTPKGTYYTSNKYRWHTLMGPSYGQYCTRIVGGILFHSVAGRNMTSYNLKASDYNKLGSPASHGCVRLCVRDAKWIYDYCKSGTKVVIYDSSSPGPLGKPATIKIPSWQTWDPTDPNL